MKVSDAIAKYLQDREVRVAFGIIGSANAHIFDSIATLGYTKIIPVHHEQAACMAMQTYYRIEGKIAAALVTAGGGSSNAITGVMSAWADSIPGLVISGQENNRFIQAYNGMRMWGIQGYDSPLMVDPITKFARTVRNPGEAIDLLDLAYVSALSDRPGPSWIDYPMDIQSSLVDSFEFLLREIQFRSEIETHQIDEVLNLIHNAERPVFWLGNGLRLDDSYNDLKQLHEKYSIPTLLSWAAKDLLTHDHKLNCWSAGIYGNRASNFVLQNSDLVIAIGTRLAIPQIGYAKNELAREADVVIVDIDKQELEKNAELAKVLIHTSAKSFIRALLDNDKTYSPREEWIAQTLKWKKKYGLVGSEHKDTKGFINSYRFIHDLNSILSDDEIIVTDMGTALLSGHQSFPIKGSQRFMTSTGLGEMGYGLPAAIGCAFAQDVKRVICLNCDGGIMMNLQELQTIDHFRLNIKIFIFNNDGYLMIRHTQKNLLKGKFVAVDSASNVTCPDFSKIANAFNLDYIKIESSSDYFEMSEKIISDGPVIIDVMMDPEQYFHPKLGLGYDKNGKIVSPPLEDLSPLLSLKELEENMLIPIHEKSRQIDR